MCVCVCVCVRAHARMYTASMRLAWPHPTPLGGGHGFITDFSWWRRKEGGEGDQMADRRVAVGLASSSSSSSRCPRNKCPGGRGRIRGGTPYQLVSKAGRAGGGGATSWLWLVGEGRKSSPMVEWGGGDQTSLPPTKSREWGQTHPQKSPRTALCFQIGKLRPRRRGFLEVLQHLHWG